MDFILLTLEDYAWTSILSYLPLLVLFGKLSNEQVGLWDMGAKCQNEHLHIALTESERK